MQSLKCRIYSIKRCGVYWKFRFIEAAFIQRRRLFEEGVLFKIIFLNIDNNYGITFENIMGDINLFLVLSSDFLIFHFLIIVE